jgi:endonuclease I
MKRWSLLFSFLVTIVVTGFAQGTETFTNISGSSASYATVTWTGDNGLSWTATDSRTDIAITGKAVTVRNGKITCNGIPNGIGSISFKHQQQFSGTGGVLEVWINGVLVGSANPTTTLQTASLSNINVSGAFSLEIRQTTSGLRIAVDDITWTSYSGNPCVAPSAQPTNIAFTSITNTTANVSFSVAAGADKYLAIRSTSSSLTNQPVNGTSYSEGDAIGNGIVSYSGSNNSFVAGDLLPGTTYYFFIYSFNDVNCSGGPTYFTTTPLTGNVTTTTPPACVAPVSSISNLQLTSSSSSVNGNFTVSPDADGYLIIQSTSSSLSFTPSNGVTYTAGQTAGNGLVVKSGVGNTFFANGLTASTTYYFYVFPENNFNCTGGPLYKTTSVSGNIATATTGTGDWPTGYYDFANGKTCSALKTALKQITDDVTGSFSGDNYAMNTQGYNSLWNQYLLTDIKPREVGTGSANVIWDIYSDNPTGVDPYNFTPGTAQCGSYSGEASCYNREHSFPKSWFNDASPMVSDYIHIFPTDGYVNGKRSNYKYGEVASASWTSLNGSKLGTSSTAGINGPVFEPINEYKGDLARVYLYMVTRYENFLSTWDGYATEGAETLDGTTYPAVDINYLKLMLKWNAQDPVSQKEKDRNNCAFSFQGNRNPFVDHPEYVTAIWNSNCPGLSALPVDLIFFTGKLDGNKILLNWEVATEINFDRYEVERSFNGTDYIKMGTVKAEGKPNYSYIDNIESLSGRRIYYRLKKVDRDGKYSYSAVFSIHIPLNIKFTVYPNPAASVIRLQLNNGSNEQASVSITEITGKTIYRKQINANQGLVEIPTTGFSSGIYIVKLLTNGAEYSQRIMVLK